MKSGEPSETCLKSDFLGSTLSNEAAYTGHLPDMMEQVRALRAELEINDEEYQKTKISVSTISP